jgi:hypothetical protein
MFGILLPVMLIDGLKKKRNPVGGDSTARIANADHLAHRMLFILLGQVIQLLCVRRITLDSINTAHDILRVYNSLFALCFPDQCVYNQHFNGSHLRGNYKCYQLL